MSDSAAPTMPAPALAETRATSPVTRLATLTATGGVGVAVATGLVFFALRVTRYPLALAGGITELMLQLKFIANPGLLAGEFVRESVLGMVSPATWVLGHAARSLDVSPVAIEYALLLALNVLAVVVVWCLAWTLFRDVGTGLLAVLLMVGGGMGERGLSFQWNLGNYAEWHFFGLLLGVTVVTLALADRYVAAAAVVGLLLSVHPSHALVSAVLLVAMWLVRESAPRLRQVLVAATAFVVTAAPAVLYVAIGHGVSEFGGIEPGPWWELMRARKGWHLFPLSWGVATWLYAIVSVVAGCWARAAVTADAANDPAITRRERTVTAVLVAVGILCALAFLFSELVPVAFITKLSLFRASNYIQMVLAAYLCDAVRRALTSRARVDVAIGAMLACAMVWMEVPLTVFLAVALVGALVVRGALAGHAIDAHRRTSVVAVALVVAVTSVHVYLEARPSLVRPSSHPAQLRAWKDVQEWARTHTPPGARFVTPPNPCGFETFSDRAVIISACDAGRSVYVRHATLEEIRRIRAYGGPGPLSADYFRRLDARYAALDAAGIESLARQFGASYAVVVKPSALALPRIYENADFVVYRVGAATVP